MRLKQESEKMMTVCAKKRKRENDVVFFFIIYYFNVRRITLPRMSDNQSWLLGETARFTSDYTCNHVYICTIAKKKHFHDFLEFSVMSIHRN